jgi:hypothetical protein
MERTGVEPEDVDHVVFGNVLQTSSDAVYGARHVGLKAGLPIEVPALTVNRLCGSGIQAAVNGGQMIQLGEADVVLTGGMESMSQAPHVIRGLRNGLRLGQGALEDSLWSALLDTHCGCTMAGTAENCAAKYGISREDQDRYAIRSQQLADAAWQAGRFKDEVVPVEITSRRGVELFARDEADCAERGNVLLRLRQIVDEQVGFPDVLVRPAMPRVELERPLVVLERLLHLSGIAIGEAEVVLDVRIARVADCRGRQRADRCRPVPRLDRLLACRVIGAERGCAGVLLRVDGEQPRRDRHANYEKKYRQYPRHGLPGYLAAT